MDKDELFRRIRADAAAEGLSIRALARRHGVHRRLVREALTRPRPKPRRQPVRRSPRLDPYKKTIDEWLRADLKAPRKQRHTAKRIMTRLAEEMDAQIPYPTIRDYVTARRPQIAAEASAPIEGMIIRHNRPGFDAEVDFGDVTVNLAGRNTVCQLFTFRMAYSGRAVHMVTVTCNQESFLEGHEYAFNMIGGVPVGQIRYDNLSAAVQRVIFKSRSRIENPRWAAFQEHYGFTAFYCLPGLEGAHEKGGVEGGVGYARRNLMVPVPIVNDLEELNEKLAAQDLGEQSRHIGHRPTSIGEDFTLEAPLLGPLPAEAFGSTSTLHPRVDRESTVTVRMNRYSVPARFIGQKVRVALRAVDLTIYNGQTEIAHHSRLPGRGGQHLVLDHYLEVLLKKPGALAGSETLDQARGEGTFTSDHEAFWARLKATGDETAATRTLINVLLLHRRMHHDDVTAGIRAALNLGVPTLDIVAVEARKAAQEAGRSPTITGTRPSPPPSDPPQPLIGEQTLKRLSDLPNDNRPPPDLTRWDQLLQKTRKEQQ